MLILISIIICLNKLQYKMNINSKIVYKKPDLNKIEVLSRKTSSNGVTLYQVKYICPQNKLFHNRIAWQPYHMLAEHKDQLRRFQKKLDESIVQWSPFQQQANRAEIEDRNMFNNFKNSGIIFNKGNSNINNEVQANTYPNNNQAKTSSNSLGNSSYNNSNIVGCNQFSCQRVEKIGNIFLHMEKRQNQMQIDVDMESENQNEDLNINKDECHKIAGNSQLLNHYPQQKQANQSIYDSELSLEEQQKNIAMFHQLKRPGKIIEKGYSNRKFKKCKNIERKKKDLQQNEKICSVKQIYEEDKIWYAIVELGNNDKKIIFRDDLRILAPQLLLKCYQQLFEKKRKQSMMIV